MIPRGARRWLCALLVAAAPGLAGALDDPGAAQDLAHRHYILHCAGCHQMDGSGAPASGVPDARGVMRAFARDAEGRSYLVRVPGAAQSPLSDAELAAVLSFMAQRFGDVSQAPAADFTADEVARERHHPLTDAEALRARLLQRLLPR